MAGKVEKMEVSKEDVIAREAMLARKEELADKKRRAALERFRDDVDEALIESAGGSEDAAARLEKIGDDAFAQCMKARGECVACSWRERCRTPMVDGRTFEALIPQEKLRALRGLRDKENAVEFIKCEVATVRERIDRVKREKLEPLESLLADAEKDLSKAERDVAEAKKVLESLIA